MSETLRIVLGRHKEVIHIGGGLGCEIDEEEYLEFEVFHGEVPDLHCLAEE